MRGCSREESVLRSRLEQRTVPTGFAWRTSSRTSRRYSCADPLTTSGLRTATSLSGARLRIQLVDASTMNPWARILSCRCSFRALNQSNSSLSFRRRLTQERNSLRLLSDSRSTISKAKKSKAEGCQKLLWKIPEGTCKQQVSTLMLRLAPVRLLTP